jgi:hypothetical protein
LQPDNSKGHDRGWKKKKRTFERDDDYLLLSIPAPLLDLSERIDKHACIDDDDIGLLVSRLLDIVGAASPRGGWTVFLLVLVLLRVCGGDPDTANGELPTLRIGRGLLVWTGAIPPIVAVAVVVARRRRARGCRDGLFELFDLVGEESSAERAGHSDLVRRGTLEDC